MADLASLPIREVMTKLIANPTSTCDELAALTKLSAGTVYDTLRACQARGLARSDTYVGGTIRFYWPTIEGRQQFEQPKKTV